MEVLGDEHGVAFACEPFEGLEGVADVFERSAGFGFCDPSQAVPGLGFPTRPL